MTKDEALKLALEFIERVNKDGWILADFEPQMYEAMNAIKKALAQPKQEPVAEVDDWRDSIFTRYVEYLPSGTRLYTTPLEPKPMTDEEIDNMCPKFEDPMRREMWMIGFKAAHGIKGEA